MTTFSSQKREFCSGKNVNGKELNNDEAVYSRHRPDIRDAYKYTDYDRFSYSIQISLHYNTNGFTSICLYSVAYFSFSYHKKATESYGE